jgi:hypothetical protein
MHDLALDLAYFFAALCIGYKIAWINRQTFDLVTWPARLMRWSGMIVALLILAKSLWRFEDGDAATLLDVTREFAWCGFLFAAIAQLRK